VNDNVYGAATARVQLVHMTNVTRAPDGHQPLNQSA